MRYEAVQVGADAQGKGGVVHLIPVILDTWPPELKDAVAIRREATLKGRCQCGASWELPSREARRAAIKGKYALHGWMVHENDCQAHDESIKDIIRRHGMTQ